MRKLIKLSLLFFAMIAVNSAASNQKTLIDMYPFLASTNIVRSVRNNYSVLEEFYGDYYIPNKERKSHKKAPPFTPHTMEGDMKSCKDCHSKNNYKELKYAGIKIPSIPKLVPSGGQHPQTQGSCRMCHVNKKAKYKMSEFYLDEVYPRIYYPKK
ncbi:hypothetical protein MJH12_03050 [bacterium]|nr:hypothetical protein [bacterium]